MYLGGNRRWVPLINAKNLAKVSNKQPRRSGPLAPGRRETLVV